MANDIKVLINDVEYTEFINITIDTDMSEVCHSFSLQTLGNENFPLFRGQEITIKAKDYSLMRGYIEKCSPDVSSDGKSFTVAGRCINADIVDSNISGINISGGIKLETLIQKILDSLDIDNTIINKVSGLTSFTNKDAIASEPDQNAWDLINQYSQKKSVIVTSDLDSKLIITRTGDIKAHDSLINKLNDTNQENNIVTSSAEYDDSARYYKYVVISQENKKADKAKFTLASISGKGIAYDNEIRKSRIFIKKADNSCNSIILAEMAQLEVNLRRANSLTYSCTLNGLFQSNGKIWQNNQLVYVKDEDNFIDSWLLIKSCSYNIGTDGSYVNMELVTKDAISLNANMDNVEERTNQIAQTNKKFKKATYKSENTKNAKYLAGKAIALDKKIIKEELDKLKK